MQGTMIRVIGGLAIAGAIWAGWWAVDVYGKQAAINAWLTEQRARGWQAEAAALSVSGFPTHAAVSATELALANPDAGWSWAAEAVTVASALLSPTRVQITLPPRQSIATPAGRLAVQAQSMDGLLDVAPGTALRLRAIAMTGRGVAVRGPSGPGVAIDAISADLTERSRPGEPDHSYDMTLRVDELTLPPGVLAPTASDEPTPLSARGSGHAAFTRALDRSAVEDRGVGLAAMTVDDVTVQWGDVAVSLSARIIADRKGFAEGEIEIQARDWRRLLTALRRIDVIPEALFGTVRSAIDLYRGFTGQRGEDLSLALTMRGGQIRIGPIPFAAAPIIAQPR